MSAHTPGPWEWYWKLAATGEAECGVYWQKHEGMAQSVCRAPRYEKQPQWEANARLIAAAPELLDALQQIADLPAHPMRKKAAEIARAAIAKATQP